MFRRYIDVGENICTSATVYMQVQSSRCIDLLQYTSQVQFVNILLVGRRCG